MDLMLLLALLSFLILVAAWLALPASARIEEPLRVSVARRSAAEA